MTRRTIMIFPQFENMQSIEKIRQKYDPLYNHVAPHITLVFPFDSDIETEQLRGHLSKSLRGIKPFHIKLQGITPVKSYGNYLYLNILEGKEEIIEIHQRLYQGILEEYIPKWLVKEGYRPHVTVGNVNDEEEYIQAIENTKELKESFETIVEKISVEIIDENEDSIIELHVPLGR